MQQIKEKILEYIEMKSQEMLLPVTEKDEKEFEEFCRKNQIIVRNQLDEHEKLNYYEIKSIQNDAYKKIKEKEERLFTKIEKEIRIGGKWKKRKEIKKRFPWE